MNGISRNSTIQLALGVLIGVAAVGSIYAFVDASATNMSAGFATAETNRHANVAAFTTAIAKAADERGAASARCDAFTKARRNLCIVEAHSAELHARSDAREIYKDSSQVSAIRPAATRKPARNIDVVLYRAHRQWPE